MLFFLPLIFASLRLTTTLAAGTASSIYYVVELDNTDAVVLDVVDEISVQAKGLDAELHLRHVFDSAYFRGFSFDLDSEDSVDSLATIIDELLSHTAILHVWPTSMKGPQNDLTRTSSHNDMRRKRDAETKPNLMSPSGPFLLQRDEYPVDNLSKRAGTNTTDAFPPHIMTNVNKLHADGVKGRGIKIAVVDACFDYKREVFGGSIGADQKITYGYNWQTDTSDPYCSCDNHGSNTLGVIAANPTRYNLVGVAPEASIELHGISDCGASLVEDDFYIHVMTSIAERGVDVISTVYNDYGPTAWPNTPRAVVWSRIQAAGTFITVSAGNKSPTTPFSLQTPANGIGVPGVGTVYNMIKPYVRWNGTYTANGVTTSFLYTPLGGVNGAPTFPSNLKLWTPSVVNVTENPGTRDFGQPSCQEVTGALPDFNKTLVLLDYSACYNVNGTYLGNAGVQYMLWYSARALPGISSWDSDSGSTTFIGVGTTDYETAKSLALLIEAGHDTQFAFGSELSYHQLPDDITAGRMGAQSAMGPTLDSRIGPMFAAPGDRILLVGRQDVGGFTTAKGTSFSAPFAAGCAALVKQVNPGWSTSTISAALSLTAQPVPNNDYSDRDFGYLAPTQRQGGGLLDCYAAAYTTTYINDTSLSFNTTRNPRKTVAFRVTNQAASTVSYNLHHIPAGSFYAFPNSSQLAVGPISSIFHPPELTVASFAVVEITPSTIEIPSGGFVDVSVSLVSLPSGVETGMLPIYGGYITLNCTQGPEFACFDYSVPYTGIAAELYDITVLTNIVLEEMSPDGTESYGAVKQGHIFTVTYANGTVTADQFPGYSWSAALLPQRYIFEMVDYKTNKTQTLEDYTGDAYSSPWLWDGTNDNNKFVPAGKYFFRASALRLEGDWNTPSDYVVTETDWFELRYTANSTGLPSS